jgi:hypothetical protein
MAAREGECQRGGDDHQQFHGSSFQKGIACGANIAPEREYHA